MSISDVLEAPAVKIVLANCQKELQHLTGKKILLIPRINVEGTNSTLRAIARNAVCEVYDIHWDKILKNSRIKNIVEARHCYFYLAHKLLGVQCTIIAHEFNMDHTSVLHGTNKILGYLQVGDKNNVYIKKAIELVEYYKKNI